QESSERGELWQLRLEQPLLALAGDRVVVRQIAPSTTLGGGVVLDAHPPRVERRAQPSPRSAPMPEMPTHELDALEARVREAGAALLSEAQMERAALRALRARGVVVRVSGRLYAHADVAREVRAQVTELIEREGPVALAQVGRA